MALTNSFTSIATGRTLKLKQEAFDTLVTVAPNVYRSAAGNLYTSKKVPGIRTLEKYSDDAVAKTPCGCRVEPDGTCGHGVPSWMLIAGVI